MKNLVLQKMPGKDGKRVMLVHVLAVALYNILKAENFNDKKEIFRDFLIRNIENKKLLNGNIEKINNQFYTD